MTTATAPQAQFRTVDGVRVRYAESTGARGRTVVLTSPWPESVTVGTGGAAVPIQLGEPLASWVLDPDLEKYRKMDSRAIVSTAIGTIAGGVPDRTRADYLACYDGERFVESMRYARRYPEELPLLAELLPQITTPVTIINGRHDRVVPLANAEFLNDRLPSSRVAIIDGGHFIWEEAPAEYASIVLESVSGNWP